ncbi:MAG: Verru_Chthon cassette protein D [Verrucomicrobiota bacterium]
MVYLFNITNFLPLKKRSLFSKGKKGFSLVEILVVLGIMAILSGIGVVGFQRLSKSSKLTQASQILSNQLQYARQSAMTKNCLVEIQFLALPDPSRKSEKAFRAIRLLTVDSTGTHPLDRIAYLPENVVFSSEETLSSLLNSDKILHDETSVNGEEGIEYYAFRFHSDGTTTLLMDGDSSWHLTIVFDADIKTSAADLKNFYTVAINPLTGLSKSYTH